MNVKMTTTKKKSRIYSPIHPPRLSMSELICKTLDHDAYWDWFLRVRERRHSALRSLRRGDQLLACSKGDFVPENIFMRTVDTARPYLDYACVPSSFDAGPEALHDACGIHDGVSLSRSAVLPEKPDLFLSFDAPRTYAPTRHA
jgi:hypothetical protein